MTKKLSKKMEKNLIYLGFACALFVLFFNISNRKSESGLLSLLLGGTLGYVTVNEITDGDLEESLLSPILDSASEYATGLTSAVGVTLTDGIVNSFNPSFDFLASIINGENVTDNVGNPSTSTQSDIFGMSAITDFLNAAKIIGLSISSLLLLGNLCLFLFGKGEQIKISLPQLLLNYILSMVLIMGSETFIWEMCDTFGNIWQSVVMSDSGVALTFENFSGIITYVMATIVCPPLAPLLIFIAIIVLWKFFKQFLKMYMAIIEHYFVMLLLMLFCPIVIPTMLTPATSNMFKSYVRMIISQFILMALTVLMMSLFVKILVNGGWTAGIVNYIAGLAFLKVAQSLDMYMSKMGLDIVTGAGNFMSSARGSGQGLLQLIRGVSMLKNGYNGIQATKMENALANNDIIGFEEASKKVIGSTKSAGAIQNDFENKIKSTYQSGNNTAMFTSSGSVTAIDQAMGSTSNRLSSSYVRGLSQMGIDKSSIHSVRQNGDAWGFFDRNNKCVATASGRHIYKNTHDTTSYSTDTNKYWSFASNKGGSNVSNLVNENELNSVVPGCKGLEPIKGEGISNMSLLEDSQYARVKTGENSYKHVIFAPAGSEGGFNMNVPNNWQGTTFTNSNGENVRVMYSPDNYTKPYTESNEPQTEQQSSPVVYTGTTLEDVKNGL